MTLNDLKEGQQAMILKVRGRGAFRHRIIEMGFVRGQMVTVLRSAPLKDPVEFRILDSEISLRRAEAALIEVMVCTPEEASKYRELQPGGAFEHVGNYSGVTVDTKTIEFTYKGHKIRLTDLPGTYSLSPYSPEEKLVMAYLLEHKPDVLVNVVDASNLERNLYMTTQLIDMDYRGVMALNMYDELQASGAVLDMDRLGLLIGMPIVPTVGRSKKGGDALLDKIIEVNEDRDKTVRHVHIPYAEEVENSLRQLQEEIWKDPWYDQIYSSRYLAIKLLEGDAGWVEESHVLEHLEDLQTMAENEGIRLQKLFGEDVDQVFADYRYAFVRGALREAYKPAAKAASSARQDAEDAKEGKAVAVASSRRRVTEKLDRILTHRIWGFPIFLAFLWVMFQATFTIGQYPMDWIDAGVAWLAGWLDSVLPDNIFRAVFVDGIVQGAGGVLVFLPNILILFFFVSIMESTGYMARVAFIMDKLMHTIGLHGKSFIPMIIGFGCNVPAIMATRTIESRKDRLITMLIIPFMSCSARLPVYVLLAGLFFPKHAGTVIFLLYLFGILVSILSALLFRHTILKAFDSPFVMEMPPYRWPTWRSVGRSLWVRGKQYLKKIGGIILIASIIVWALGYFPVGPEAPAGVEVTPEMQAQLDKTHLEQSYLSRIGRFIEPVIRPLGMNWEMGVCLLAGISAKEVVVSTMVMIMNPASSFTSATALSFLVFVLLYFPCIGVFSTVARESGSWRWAVFMAVYTTAVAWIVSFIVFQVGTLLW